MTETTVRTTAVDEESSYRVQSIRASSSKWVNTPIKAIDFSKTDKNLTFHVEKNSIAEFYRGIARNFLKQCQTHPGKQSAFNSQLKSKINTIRDKENTITLCFLEFKEADYPNPKELEFLTSTAYHYSDIVPIPSLSLVQERIGNESMFERYQAYLLSAIESLKNINNKPIMGMIPNTQFFVEDIAEIYLDNGINSFCIDADGRNPLSIHQTITALLKYLNRRKQLDSSFIHILNANYGRGVRIAEVVPAKDILAYALGINSVGEKHKKPTGTKEYWDNLNLSPENKFRLFDKSDYGYRKMTSIQEISEHYPKDSELQISEFVNAKINRSKVQNAFNMEQLALEAINLREIIKEKTGDSVLNYVTEKSSVMAEDLKIIKKTKNIVTSR